jgi:hypothetical protein
VTGLRFPQIPEFETDQARIVDQSTEEGSPSKLRDEIQWPALDKLTPGNLKRTVSTIMKEWEKSLTPPPPEDGKQVASKPAAPAKDVATEATEEERAISQLPHF